MPWAFEVSMRVPISDRREASPPVITRRSQPISPSSAMILTSWSVLRSRMLRKGMSQYSQRWLQRSVTESEIARGRLVPNTCVWKIFAPVDISEIRFKIHLCLSVAGLSQGGPVRHLIPCKGLAVKEFRPIGGDCHVCSLCQVSVPGAARAG